MLLIVQRYKNKLVTLQRTSRMRGRNVNWVVVTATHRALLEQAYGTTMKQQP